MAIFAIPICEDLEMICFGEIIPKFFPPASVFLKPEMVIKPGFVFINDSLVIMLFERAPATVSGLINDPGSNKSSIALFLTATL